ncbi:MAG: hypothetical protein OSB21_11945, partial [Myxococcota bacterium]|nr:hypothetical protein [Myxococcota bacterium]
GATIRWQSDAELAAGESRTFTLRVRLSSGLASGTRIAVNAGFIGDTLQVFQAEPVVLIIDALPVLTLTKAVAPSDDGQYNPGELLRYTLTLTNTSTVLAEQLLVRDALPEGLVQGVASQGGQVVDGVALWNAQSTPALQGLGAGESLQLELTARITAPMEDRRELLNQARLSAAGAEAIDSDDPATPGIVGDPTSITVRSQTNLVVEKSQTALGERPYEPGTQVTYRLRVAAGGTQRARGLVLADTLPEGISYVSSSPTALVNGSNISWSATQAPGLGNLAPSTEVILNMVVQIDDRALAGTIISNQARVRGDTHNGDLLSNDPDTVAVDDETSFLVGGAPNLSVIKTVEESLADNFWRIGEQVRYRIVIRNNGSVDVANLSILDLIDPNLSEVVVDGDWGSFADGRISGAVARLNHGSDITLSFTARLSAAPNGTLVVNQASVSVAGSNANVLSDDPSSPGDADPTVLTLSAEEGLSLLKAVEDLNGGSVLPGDRLRYSITLTNTGETPSGAVSFSDTFDQRLQIIGVEAGLQNSIVEQRVTWSVGGLDSGESVSAHVIAQVVDGLVQGSTIDNQAEMSFEGETLFSDDGEVGNDDPTPTRVVIGEIPVPQPVMSKSVEPSAVARGETATWTITLRNEGSGALDNAQWTDVLPEGLEIIDVQGATALGNTLSASLDLDPDEETEIVVSTRVLPSAGELISNQASLVFEGEELLSDDPDTAQQGDSTELRIMPATLDPLLEKTVTDLNGEPLEPGDEVEYLIILRNRGSEALPSFVLSDELDENLRFVEGSLVIQDVVVPGANMLAQGLALDAGLQPGESISLRFRAQVVDEAEQGQLITNQAQLIDGQSQRWLSDDPNLPGGPQPTLLQVGSSGAIAAYKTVSP